MFNTKIRLILFTSLLLSASLLAGCSVDTTNGTEVTLENGEQAGTIVTIATNESDTSGPLAAAAPSNASSLETAASSGAGDDIIVAQSTTISDGYSFDYYGTQIAPGQASDPVIEALGTAYEYYEQISDASNSVSSNSSEESAPGVIKIYTYRDITLYAASNAGEYYISAIDINSNSCSTSEGIQIGSTADAVIAAYGDSYNDNGDSISYKSGDSQLSFFFVNGKVSDITYDFIAE